MVEIVEGRGRSVATVNWGAVFAGAVAAAALASVLHAFAGAIGLAVSSSAPTWRDASIGLWFLSGVYLVLVALASYGLGGYLTGMLCERYAASAPEESELRDNVHGLLAWAVATLITVTLALMVAAMGTRAAAPSGSPMYSVASENTIAYDVDRLLRGDRRQGEDLAATRAEVGRILLTSSGHSGVSGEDRAYLSRLVAARTGLAQAEAERRVESVIASVRQNLARARKSSTILAFMAGAAALLGSVAAWFAAGAGGQHRDDTAGSGRWNVLGRRASRSAPNHYSVKRSAEVVKSKEQTSWQRLRKTSQESRKIRHLAGGHWGGGSTRRSRRAAGVVP